MVIDLNFYKDEGVIIFQVKYVSEREKIDICEV